MFHGLIPKKTRQLAFHMSTMNNLPIPEKWQAEKMAGEDWMTTFLSRHPDLSIRSAEAISLARATALNMKRMLHLIYNGHCYPGTQLPRHTYSKLR